MPTGNINRMSTNFNECRPVSQGGRDPSPSILKNKAADGSKVTRKSSGVQWNLRDNNHIKLNRYLSGSSNRRVKTSMLKPKTISTTTDAAYNDPYQHTNPGATKQIDLMAYRTIENLESTFEAIKNEGQDLEDKECVTI
jgi:hypothetical protein